MITYTILAILGVALFFVLRQMMRTPPGPKVTVPSPPPALGTGADVANARIGDVVSIHAGSADFTDLDFTVDRRSRYESGPRRWIDLSGDFRGHRVYLEVHPGGETAMMGILDPRRLTLHDLGLTEDDLVSFDERQDPNASVSFEGARWMYDSSREIGYFENEQGQGEGLYRWLFREQGGDRLLCIEKWEGEAFEGRIARRLNPADVTLYRAA